MAVEAFTGELDEEVIPSTQVAPVEVAPAPPSQAPAAFSGALDAAPTQAPMAAPVQAPAEPSVLDKIKSFVSGEGRMDPSIPELNTMGMPLQNASPEQQLQMLQQEELNREEQFGMAPRSIQEGGVDEFGNPLVTVDGEPAYINKPGASVRDLEDAKQMLPEMMVSLAMPVKGALLKSLAAVGLTASANKLADTLSVDEQTGIEREMREHAEMSATEGGMAVAGEGAGRAFVMAGQAVTEAVANVWKRATGGLMPNRWVAKDGSLTPEAVEGFRKAGIPEDEILPEVVVALKQVPGDVPTGDVAARAAESQALNIPSGVADLTQDPTSIAAAQRLALGSEKQGGDVMRQAAVDYTQAVKKAGEKIAPKRGTVSDFDLGKKVRNTLFLTKESEGRAAGDLYTAARDAVGGDHILTRTEPIERAIEEISENTKHLVDEREVVMSMNQILNDFGIVGDPADARFKYNVGNSEKLIQRFNELASSASVRRKGTDGLVNQMKHVVLDQLSEEVNQGMSVGGASAAKLGKFGKARANWSQYMKNWQSADIVDDLLANKTFGTNSLPKISDSDVLKKVRGAPVEDAQRLMHALKRGGREGADTVQDLRSSMVASLLEDSIEDGIVPVLNSKMFDKAMSAYPEGTLATYFTPKQMGELKTLRRIVNRKKMKTIGSMAADDQVGLEIAQRVLGSVWLFRHSPTVATGVAIGKVAQKGATQRVKRKAVEYQVGGTESLRNYRGIPKDIPATGAAPASFTTAKKSQRSAQRTAAMIADIEKNFPKLAALMTGRGARTVVKAAVQPQLKAEDNYGR